MVVSQFPPMGGVAVSRTYTFARYWQKAGAEVTVITPKKYRWLHGSLDYYPNDVELGKMRIIEVDYMAYLNALIDQKRGDGDKKSKTIAKGSKLKGWFRKLRYSFLGNSFDLNFLWQKVAIKEANSILKDEKFDIMFSSFTPQASFVVASALKRLYPDLFWVTDYRDLWTQNHILKMHPVVKFFQERKEKKLLKCADMITTTSPSFAESLENLHQRKVEIFTNGFDKELFSSISSHSFFKNEQKIRIVHVGTIYKGNRDPSPLFGAIQKIFEEDKRYQDIVEIYFYGDNGNLSSIVDAYGLSDTVIDGGMLSKEDALRAIRDADILLLLDNVQEESLSAKGMIPAKLYEYIYLKKPIVSIGVTKECFSGEILLRSGLGSINGWSEQKIYNQLKEVFGNKALHNIDNNFIEQFDREKIADRFYYAIKERLNG